MRRHSDSFVWWTILCAVCLAMLAAACGRVPFTGRRQMLLVSEAEEVELGATTYGDVLSSAKLSTDAAETQRVRTIGGRIAAATGKTDYKWEFNLIDGGHGC